MSENNILKEWEEFCVTEAYQEICNEAFKDKSMYFLTDIGDIGAFYYNDFPIASSKSNTSPSKLQLKSLLAKNLLANLAHHFNDGWQLQAGYIITLNCQNKPIIVDVYNGTQMFGNVVFKSRELAEKTIQILGEETVKLALTPLY